MPHGPFAGLRLARPYGADSVRPLRRSPAVRHVLRSLRRFAVGAVAVVAVITWLFVAAFGHPLAWALVGAFFAAAPLALLAATVAVGLRAAVATGPGWVGLRLVGGWRRLDLGRVRTVRSTAGGNPFWGPAAVGGVVLEDADGQRITLAGDLIDGPLGDAVRRSLPHDAVIDVDAWERPDPPPGA